MDDSFELEYADELEALDDSLIEAPSEHVPPKSKRSLHFESPKKKSGTRTDCRPNGHVDGVLSPEVNGLEDDELSQLAPEFESVSQKEWKDSQNRKRAQGKSYVDDFDEVHEDDEFNDLQDFASVRKRPRLMNSGGHSGDSNTTEGPIGDNIISQVVADHAEIQQRTTRIPQSQAAGTQPRLNDAEDLERPRVRKHIPQCDFLSAVGYDGQRVYMKLWDEEVLEAEYSSLGNDARASGLLMTPVCVLREQIEEEHSRRILQEADELHDKIRRQIDQNAAELGISDMDTVDEEEDPSTEGNKDTEKDDVGELTENMKSLWVDKYAPQKYTELLSEESINRSLLHWLKLWDYVVFGKDVPKPVKKNNKYIKDKEKEQKFKKKLQSEVVDELDKHNRPQQKIALLCGPPGLGKTTLAHIVARHAGYNVVEMNASDDRSVDVFRNKLESATQMKSVVEADPRPNCLVIDEIDGAPGPAINVLLNTLKKSENEAGSNKKKNDGGMLLRPIICVCNDQYVPALRQLRQMAVIFNFPQTESSRLASRLYEVAKGEMLKVELNALLALCEKTDNDIRSCLNTLQFVRQKQKELTLREVQTMSVGQKDTQKSLFSVWKDIFTMPRPQKNRFVSIHDLTEGKQENLQTTNITPTARFQHIMLVSQSAGEHDRVMQGLHENYLEAKSKDPHLIGLNLGNEWLCFADCNNHYVARNQDYSVMKFSSFLPVVFHFLYASYNPSRIQFPHSQSDAHQKLQKTYNLLTTMVSDMSPIVRKFNNPRNLILDLLPPLLDVLQPTLRPVNTQLYSSREKEELSNVVKIMIAYNMTYHQEKTPEGQYVYVLDPNVEEVVKFPGLKQRKQLTYAAKQMIAREIELEKMRRSEAPATKPVPKSNEEQQSDKSKPAPAVPNHLQRLEAKSLAQEKPTFNFFGNFVRTKREKPKPDPVDEPAPDESKKELLDTLIWFHFKEGFSNAVRRNVKVQDFF